MKVQFVTEFGRELRGLRRSCGSTGIPAAGAMLAYGEKAGPSELSGDAAKWSVACFKVSDFLAQQGDRLLKMCLVEIGRAHV